MLGLDIGEARVGVALSDPSGSVATPLQVLDARTLVRDAGALKRLVEDYDVGALVVGLPLTLGGDEGPQAAVVRETAERLGRAVGLPVEFVDERLTTTQAHRAMKDGGADKGAKRSVDMIAATLLLQAHLDAGRSGRDTGSDDG